MRPDRIGSEVWLLTTDVFGRYFAIKYVYDGKYLIETDLEIDVTAMSGAAIRLTLAASGVDSLYYNKESPYMRDVFDMSFFDGCVDLFEDEDLA